jgi:hypothetical protein
VTRGVCRHCGKGPKYLECRMLCWSCWRDRSIRVLHPTLKPSGGAGAEFSLGAEVREARIPELARRAALRLPLFPDRETA